MHSGKICLIGSATAIIGLIGLIVWAVCMAVVISQTPRETVECNITHVGDICTEPDTCGKIYRVEYGDLVNFYISHELPLPDCFLVEGMFITLDIDYLYVFRGASGIYSSSIVYGTMLMLAIVMLTWTAPCVNKYRDSLQTGMSSRVAPANDSISDNSSVTSAATTITY